MNTYNTIQVNTLMVSTLLALNGISQGCIVQTITAGSQPQAVLGLNNVHMRKD